MRWALRCVDGNFREPALNRLPSKVMGQARNTRLLLRAGPAGVIDAIERAMTFCGVFGLFAVLHPFMF